MFNPLRTIGRCCLVLKSIVVTYNNVICERSIVPVCIRYTGGSKCEWCQVFAFERTANLSTFNKMYDRFVTFSVNNVFVYHVFTDISRSYTCKYFWFSVGYLRAVTSYIYVSNAVEFMLVMRFCINKLDRVYSDLWSLQRWNKSMELRHAERDGRSIQTCECHVCTERCIEQRNPAHKFVNGRFI